MPPTLLSLSEVSGVLHRSRSSLLRDIDHGLLPVVRLGVSLRFNAEVIESIAKHGYAAVAPRQEA
jgi:hypothetical protein